MFETLSAWREVGHLAEYTGLSVGMLAGCGALFLYVPGVRLFACAGALLAAGFWFGSIRGEVGGHRDGKAEVQAQWDDAREAAIKADEDRDVMIGQQLEQKYGPLREQAAADKARADDYASRIGTLTRGGAGSPRAAAIGGAKAVAAAVAACELGDAAGGVPVPRQAPKLRAR